MQAPARIRRCATWKRPIPRSQPNNSLLLMLGRHDSLRRPPLFAFCGWFVVLSVSWYQFWCLVRAQGSRNGGSGRGDNWISNALLRFLLARLASNINNQPPFDYWRPGLSCDVVGFEKNHTKPTHARTGRQADIQTFIQEVRLSSGDIA